MIILIEDSASDVLYLRDALAEYGYAIEHIPTDADVIGRIDQMGTEESRILVIADLFMPGRDGIDLLREMRARQLAAPVILVSGKERQYLEMAEAFGRSWGLNIVDAMTKPVNIQGLVAHLNALDIPNAK